MEVVVFTLKHPVPGLNRQLVLWLVGSCDCRGQLCSKYHVVRGLGLHIYVFIHES
jgi:hypothetical protein